MDDMFRPSNIRIIQHKSCATCKNHYNGHGFLCCTRTPDWGGGLVVANGNNIDIDKAHFFVCDDWEVKESE